MDESIRIAEEYAARTDALMVNADQTLEEDIQSAKGALSFRHLVEMLRKARGRRLPLRRFPVHTVFLFILLSCPLVTLKYPVMLNLFQHLQ